MGVSPRNPELGGQIGIKSVEHAHAFVRERVKEIDNPNKQKSDAEEQEIVIIEKTFRIPGNYKNAKSDQDTKEFDKAVEKEIAVKATEIENK